MQFCKIENHRYGESCIAVKHFSAVDILQNRFNLRTEKRMCEKHGAYDCLIDMNTGDETLCPLCEKEQREQAEFQKNEQRRLDALLNRIDGLPKRYREAGFKNYAVTAENEAAYQIVLAFAKHPGKNWLLLLGKNGTGKTHLAHAVLKVTGGIYRDFDEIAIDLLDAQAGFGDGMNKVLDKYSYAPMLVIDEVDKVKSTAGRIGWLNIILRKRYNEMLPVILIGNIDLETLCNHIDLTGSEALRDRIKEVGQVVLFNFESYRSRRL